MQVENKLTEQSAFLGDGFSGKRKGAESFKLSQPQAFKAINLVNPGSISFDYSIHSDRAARFLRQTRPYHIR
jgi:hypothetical protein